MDVNWSAELVDQLEWHWQHQLRPRLDGLTDEEYFWQPVPGCWTLSRRGESTAPMSLGVDCRRRDRDAEAGKLAVQAPIPPRRILIGQAQDERFDAPMRGWPARTVVP